MQSGFSVSHFVKFLWHLPNFAKLYWRLFQDPRVPLRAKAIMVVAALYFVSPLDLVPNLIYPLLGTMDDLVIAWVALKWFLSLCPPDVVQEHVKQIDAENRVKEEV